MISHEQLKEILSYNEFTGNFVWLIRKSIGTHIGDIAGAIDNKGYVNICINRDRYKAHRLAWFYVNGTWPTYQIDHINMDKSDNRIENLRDVNQSKNQHNRCEKRSDAIHSKFLGVTLRKKKNGYTSYVAEIKHNKHRIYLGHFTSEEDAANAYIEAKNNLEPRPPVAAPDKKAIAKAIKEGIDVPGARLTQSSRLHIN